MRNISKAFHKYDILTKQNIQQREKWSVSSEDTEQEDHQPLEKQCGGGPKNY